MNILYPAGVKRDWYDRNMVNIPKVWAPGAIAPHAGTSRWVYTCPSGKKAIIEYISFWIQRQNVAAPVGVASMYYYMTINGINGIICQLDNKGNVTGDTVTFYQATWILLSPFDSITLYSQDTSTGGTVNYGGNSLFVEFDQ